MRQMMSIFFTSVFVWCMVVVMLCLTSCNQQFYPPTGGGPGSSNPSSPSTPNAKEPPYKWEEFGYDYGTLKAQKIVSSPEAQTNPYIFENNVVYVHSKVNAIYIKNLGTDWDTFVTSRPQNMPIQMIKLYKNVVAWIEGEGPRFLYFFQIGQSGAPRKIADDVLISHYTYDDELAITDTGIFWLTQTQAQSGKYKLVYYDFVSRTVSDVGSFNVTNFRVVLPWVVYQPQGLKDLYAYNLYTSESFKLNSDESDTMDFFTVTDQQIVIWMDNRYTKKSLFSYDLKQGRQTREKLFAILYDSYASNVRLAYADDILMVQSSESTVNFFDVRRMSRFYYYFPEDARSTNHMGNFSGRRFVLSYNDTLTKGNDDIFIVEIPR